VDEECPYCLGTGLAPGDGKTKCGFCEDGMWAAPWPLSMFLKASRSRKRKV